MEQLEKGEAWLAHTMKILGLEPWSYVGFAVFPNIANRKSLEETGLVKKEEESKVKHDLIVEIIPLHELYLN